MKKANEINANEMYGNDISSVVKGTTVKTEKNKPKTPSRLAANSLRGVAVLILTAPVWMMGNLAAAATQNTMQEIKCEVQGLKKAFECPETMASMKFPVTYPLDLSERLLFQDGKTFYTIQQLPTWGLKLRVLYQYAEPTKEDLKLTETITVSGLAGFPMTFTSDSGGYRIFCQQQISEI